jgi:transketolase
MNKISSEQIALWSKIGPRAVYGIAMQQLVQESDLVIALSADLGNSSGLDRLRRSHPERFINVGIAEQSLIGFSAGLANEGYIPFASTFAPFATMRAAEQIRMNLGYMEMNVKVVGLGSGLAMGFLGNSHYGLEDIAIMRTIPGMTILSPADCTEVVKCVQYASEIHGPTYLRLTGVPDNPIVYTEDYEFEIGRAISLTEGDDLAIIATGSIVSHALSASEILRNSGINAEVYNFHTIKPLDEAVLLEIGKKFPFVATVEEHSIVGGLGTSIAQFYSNQTVRPNIAIIGLPDNFGPTGNYQFLLNYHGLEAEQLAVEITESFHESQKIS